jgi:formylglycine-generating enzyme required for sulfatase activity
VATTFIFDATASSDAEDPGSALQVRWDWEGDGSWDRPYSAEKVAQHRYESPGTRTVRLEVRDSRGLTGTAAHEVPVVVPNAAPTARFEVQPDSGTTVTLFRFDATGCTDPEDPPESLVVRWDWEDDGGWDTAYQEVKTAGHTYPAAGSRTVRLEVKDTGGLTGSASRTVSVTGAPVPWAEVLVPAGGQMIMGDGISVCGNSRRPVTLTRGFHLGRYEVTVQEYRDLLQWAFDRSLVRVTPSAVTDVGETPEMLVNLRSPDCPIFFIGGAFGVVVGREQHPMVEVSWFGAAAYCDWFSLREGLAPAYDHATWECNGGDPYGAEGYRLPTDAEWEYASQYDDERAYPWGNQAAECARANYDDDPNLGGPGCVGSTTPVGSYPAAPAALELHDMAGNVQEWCNDWHACSLGDDAVTDPPGPSGSLYRVLRGGAYFSFDGSLRCATRPEHGTPSLTSPGVGFRVARTE